MRNEITLLKNNDEREWKDIEWIEEFYKFLQGEVPEGLRFCRGHNPKLTPKKAMAIIWYLQEHFPVLPDNIERCGNCDSLFDSNSSGLYWESNGKFFCGGCEYLVPENYDNNQRK